MWKKYIVNARVTKDHGAVVEEYQTFYTKEEVKKYILCKNVEVIKIAELIPRTLLDFVTECEWVNKKDKWYSE